MNIITGGVELDSEELLRFFETHNDASCIILCDKNGLMAGDVIAITHDDRMVLDVDIPAACELYSESFSHRLVQVIKKEDVYELTILPKG